MRHDGVGALSDVIHHIEVGNLELIEACWGVVVADLVMGHVQTRLRQAGLRVELEREHGRFLILGDIRSGGPVDPDRLASLPYQLTAEPIPIDLVTGQTGAAVHAVISWQALNIPRYRTPRDMRADHGERWFAIYKSDMQIVAYLFRCMKEGRLAPHWQAVRDYSDPGQVLYHEALLRFSEPNEALSPGVVFLALERTGLASTFDWLMVSHVMPPSVDL